MQVCLPALFVLHLAVVQAAMLPPVPSAVVAEDRPVVAAHCHEAPADETPAPALADHCDAGHCHCPIAMTHRVVVAAGTTAFTHRAPRGLLATTWPSLRQAPDTRPPIAA